MLSVVGRVRASVGRRARHAAGWLRTSSRSPGPQERALIKSFVDDAQPGFKEAVAADTRATARWRGDRHELTSRWALVLQAIRLAWVTESFFAQVCYRARVALKGRGIPILPTILHHLAVGHGQVIIDEHVVIGPGLYLPHGQVVIAGTTNIGRGVVIRPFVTIGLKDGNPFGPRIGNRVRIGTGAKVFGPLSIGRDARVGANAVVMVDVPADAIAVGVPATVRRRTPSGG